MCETPTSAHWRPLSKASLSSTPQPCSTCKPTATLATRGMFDSNIMCLSTCPHLTSSSSRLYRVLQQSSVRVCSLHCHHASHEALVGPVCGLNTHIHILRVVHLQQFPPFILYPVDGNSLVSLMSIVRRIV